MTYLAIGVRYLLPTYLVQLDVRYNRAVVTYSASLNLYYCQIAPLGLPQLCLQLD